MTEGWYADPWDPHQTRFWDGGQWTTRVSPTRELLSGSTRPRGRLSRLPGIASLPRRGLASLLDGIPVAAVNVPAAIFLGSSALHVVVAVAAGVAYFVPLIAVYGQTLGDRLVGVRVVEKSDGAVPGWKRSILRYLAFDGVILVVGNLYPSGITLAAIVIVGAALLNKQRQGLHDRTAGVLVLELPSRRS